MTPVTIYVPSNGRGVRRKIRLAAAGLDLPEFTYSSWSEDCLEISCFATDRERAALLAALAAAGLPLCERGWERAVAW